MSPRPGFVVVAWLTSLACLTACSGHDSAVTSDSDPAARQNTQRDLEAHLEFLSDDEREGRMTGQPGYDAAARYVADSFATFGLAPGGSDGWFQRVPLIAYSVDAESAALTVHRSGLDTHYKYREDFTISGDEVQSHTAVRADVVFVGFGVHAPELGYSDYDGIDVRGKLVALFDGAPATFPPNERAYYSSGRTKSAEAVARGAVGTLSLRSRQSQKSFSWERVKKLAGTRPGMAWVDDDGSAADYFPALGAGALVNAATASELFAEAPISFEEALDNAEASRPQSLPLGFAVSISGQTRHERLVSPNVIGIVRGTDAALADQYVVYTAHLDHLGVGVEENGDGVYNGAYDNAMGVSLLLETARAISASPPRRSVMFIALTGEERGLLGSDYFAHYPTVPIESIVANVNLDMPLFLYPLADLIAFGAQHSSLDVIVAAAAGGEDFALTPDPIPEETIFVRSDQYSFVRQGVPSIYLVPGFASSDPDIDGQALFQGFIENHYHRPSDDLSLNVDWDSAERFLRANLRIGTIIGNADQAPTWKEGDFFGERFGRPGG